MRLCSANIINKTAVAKSLTYISNNINEHWDDAYTLSLSLIALEDASGDSTVRTNITDPVFIIDHPYEMRPLAKRKPDDDTKVESIQLVAAGAELLNAYTELNDPQDQKNRWEEDMKRAKEGAEEFQVLDKDYIRALEYGMPPTAGWGMGIDRFVAILTNQHSLKDTILFPTLRPEK